MKSLKKIFKNSEEEEVSCLYIFLEVSSMKIVAERLHFRAYIDTETFQWLKADWENITNTTNRLMHWTFFAVSLHGCFA